MAFSFNYPTFTLRRDAFVEGEEGQKAYDELSQLVKTLQEFQIELAKLLVDRVKLPEYTDVSAANAQFTAAKGHIVYNDTDSEPMFYNGSAWKKVTDGSNAS